MLGNQDNAGECDNDDNDNYEGDSDDIFDDDDYDNGHDVNGGIISLLYLV